MKSGCTLNKGDALVVVDVQQDFLPGGSLAVSGGNAVVPVLNAYLAKFARAGLPVLATRDWHPENHCSFSENGGTWPSHCIADTPGAAFAPGLELPHGTIIISKATASEKEAYSGMENPEMQQKLQETGVRRVFVGGLATDYCVLQTVKDLLAAGFRVMLLADAIRAVDVNPGDGQAAIDEMVVCGADILRLEEVADDR